MGYGYWRGNDFDELLIWTKWCFFDEVMILTSWLRLWVDGFWRVDGFLCVGLWRIRRVDGFGRADFFDEWTVVAFSVVWRPWWVSWFGKFWWVIMTSDWVYVWDWTVCHVWFWWVDALWQVDGVLTSWRGFDKLTEFWQVDSLDEVTGTITWWDDGFCRVDAFDEFCRVDTFDTVLTSWQVLSSSRVVEFEGWRIVFEVTLDRMTEVGVTPDRSWGCEIPTKVYGSSYEGSVCFCMVCFVRPGVAHYCCLRRHGRFNRRFYAGRES